MADPERHPEGNCPACWHLWSLHSETGCAGNIYPAHSLSGEPCPCERKPPPEVTLESRAAEVDAGLWNDYADARDTASYFERRARELLIALKRQAGNAKYLSVDGRNIAVRVIRPVVNASWTTDYYRKLPQPKPAAPDDSPI